MLLIPVHSVIPYLTYSSFPNLDFSSNTYVFYLLHRSLLNFLVILVQSASILVQ